MINKNILEEALTYRSSIYAYVAMKWLMEH